MAKKAKKGEWRGSVRMPTEIHAEIERLAKTESRSFTAQLEVLLRTHPAVSKK